MNLVSSPRGILWRVWGSTEERDRTALIAPDSRAVNHAVGVTVSSRIVEYV